MAIYTSDYLKRQSNYVLTPCTSVAFPSSFARAVVLLPVLSCRVVSQRTLQHLLCSAAAKNEVIPDGMQGYTCL